jgi:hypothetical protein
LSEKTEQHHHSHKPASNPGNSGAPPPSPPPGDSPSNSSVENPRNNPSPYIKSDSRDINKLLPPVKDLPKFSRSGEYDHITFIN